MFYLEGKKVHPEIRVNLIIKTVKNLVNFFNKIFQENR